MVKGDDAKMLKLFTRAKVLMVKVTQVSHTGLSFTSDFSRSIRELRLGAIH